MRWPEVALGELVTDLQSGFASGKNISDGVIQVRMNNIGSDGQLDWTKIRRVPRPKKDMTLRAEPGDILFNATNSPELVGKTAMFHGSREDVYYSNHFYRLRPKEGSADSGYLTRFIQKRWQERKFEAICKRWVNQATVSRDDLLSLRVPVPPLDEQKRIAAILDKADALRRLRQQAIDRLNALSQSIFHEMFGNPTATTGANVSRPLKEFVSPDRPITYGILKPGPDIDGGVPYIRVVDMAGDRVDVQSVKKTTPEIAREYRRSTLAAGDLLMSIRGHVGRTAVVPPELHGANITQDTARLAVPPDEVDYFRFTIRHPAIQHWMAQRTKGAAVKGINLGDLRELPVLEVERERRFEFSSRMKTCEAMLGVSMVATDSVEVLFASLQQRAFAGEL